MRDATFLLKMKNDPDRLAWWGFALTVSVCTLCAVFYNNPIFIAIPAVLLTGIWLSIDVKPFYYILLGSLPLSTEIMVTDSLGTDLPSEPLMWVMTGICILWICYRPATVRIHHLIDLLLLAHWLWLVIVILFADSPLLSIKFLLAKTWYILTFYTMARFILHTPERWARAIWFIFLPLVVTHVIFLVRFANMGFAFADVNRVLTPFYRNHVTFAALAVVVFPYGWYLFRQMRGRLLLRTALIIMLGIILVGIQFSYTRAAYVALAGGIAAVWVIRWRLVIPAIILTILGSSWFVYKMVQSNHYLNFAPDYNKTITHYEFEDLINATYKLQDISTMERVYRWIAGGYMLKEKPITGFGTNHFYHHYKAFAAKSFVTYVSDNPERSGIHNYYLMTAVEQGIPGLLIYLCLIITVLVFGQRVYHQTQDPARRNLVMTALISAMIIHILQTMNDLVETDKVGPFFFLSLAIIVSVDKFNKEYSSIPS